MEEEKRILRHFPNQETVEKENQRQINKVQQKYQSRNNQDIIQKQMFIESQKPHKKICQLCNKEITGDYWQHIERDPMHQKCIKSNMTLYEQIDEEISWYQENLMKGLNKSLSSPNILSEVQCEVPQETFNENINNSPNSQLQAQYKDQLKLQSQLRLRENHYKIEYYERQAHGQNVWGVYDNSNESLSQDVDMKNQDFEEVIPGNYYQDFNQENLQGDSYLKALVMMHQKYETKFETINRRNLFFDIINY
eukprot:403344785